MLSFRYRAGACALALLLHPNAFAASDVELAAIRDEIRNLRATYEARIQALEQRLKAAEANVAPDPASKLLAPGAAIAAATRGPISAAAPVPARAVASAPSASSASAFNPSISAILNGTYAHLSRDPAAFALPGFAPEGEVGPGRRGFALGESELVFSASVDPYFDATLIMAVTPEDSVAVEEAYGRWLSAPLGLAPKFGRFRSGIGYLNEQHPHAWDFVDAPLPYQAFLGNSFTNDGVQLKWVAPIDTFLELGAEAGNGDAYPGAQRTRNGAGAGAVFAHAGGDVGASHSWRAGVSHLRTRSSLQGEGDEATGALASRLTIADFVWKYAPQGNARDSSLKIQGEYFTGRIREAARQSGWYLQGVYKFLPEWRVGARYDRLDAGGVGEVAHAPRKASLMLDYNPSEFSRVRLQFSRSELVAGVTDNQWFVQYVLSLGAHGAHRY